MKIATNVHRDVFGGITVSNLALFDWLKDREDTIVGIEFITARHVQGADIFRHYEPSFFRHHIVNGIDIIPRYSWEKVGNLRKHWNVLVETTKNILRQESPDVVLINGTYFVPWILMTAAKEIGIPVVTRYAGILQKEVVHKSYFVRRRLLKHERWLASVSDAVIFPSTLCRHVVEAEILKRPVKRGIVIPNPVADVPRAPRRAPHRYTIAAIGRWTPIKNFQAFIALHEELLRQNFAHKAIMVTSFHDKKFPVPETIERIDPMSQEALRNFYRSIDLLVMPSHFETFGNVAAEALVHGTSVLVSRNVGFGEILHKAGLSRMIAPSFDSPEEVAAAVKRLRKTRVTKKEREKVVRLLEPTLVHNSILKVLRRVLAEPKITK
jgi:glycosyltransferase involved in cell wall biosynthesis